MQGKRGGRWLWPVVVAVALLGAGAWWIFGSDSFYVTDGQWDRGVARNWAGYYVHADAREHAPGAVVKLRNGETRRIVRTETNGPYLNVFVAGTRLDPKVHGLPEDYKIEKGAVTANVEDDSFIVTDANWNRSVARRWPGFFVSAARKADYPPGRTVLFKNGESRRISAVEQQGPYLNVFVEGGPLDPAIHGIPPEYQLR